MTDLEKLRVVAGRDEESVIPRLTFYRPCTVITGLGSVMWIDEQRRPHRSHVFGLPVDLPAIIDLDGTKHYFWHGMYKRNGQRATLVHADGKREWVVGSWQSPVPLHVGPVLDNGTNGPAIVYPDGRVIYVDGEGEFMMEEQWTPKEARKYFPEPPRLSLRES